MKNRKKELTRTLTILKPDCIRKNIIGDVISQIEGAGFKILSMKMIRLDKELAEEFYYIHRKRPFFDDLVRFMTSGACIPIVLEKLNAVSDFRDLIGDTDPENAGDDTIRGQYATNKAFNIVHGSDSDENAVHEINFFFTRKELYRIYPFRQTKFEEE